MTATTEGATNALPLAGRLALVTGANWNVDGGITV
jgi:hypothetical protein